LSLRWKEVWSALEHLFWNEHHALKHHFWNEHRFSELSSLLRALRNMVRCDVCTSHVCSNVVCSTLLISCQCFAKTSHTVCSFSE
jgi:hypothetical protein